MTTAAPSPEGWTRVASLAELRAARRMKVRAGGADVLLVRVDDEVFACGNVCAHQHFSLLHAGTMEGHLVTCPMHGWTYDVRTGASTGGEGRVPVYPVRLAGDDVLVLVKEIA